MNQFFWVFKFWGSSGFYKQNQKKSRDPDQIGERAHRVDHQIQKTLKPTKHNNPAVGWNSDEDLTIKRIEKENGRNGNGSGSGRIFMPAGLTPKPEPVLFIKRVFLTPNPPRRALRARHLRPNQWFNQNKNLSESLNRVEQKASREQCKTK